MWNNIVKHETAALKINLRELDRKNLCDLAFVTIDGKDAKDFDDAVFCIKRNDGCLLYTSPSPRDRTRSRMPSSA